MPKSRQPRKHSDDYDDNDDKYGRGRGREPRRPRATQRRSSYDDRHDRRPRRRSRRYDDYDSEYDSESDYASPPPRRRLTRSEGRRRPRSLSRDRHHDDDDFMRRKRDQAIKSAVTAGAVEAIRQRNRPGDWMGERGLRVATAALSAAAIDTAVDRDPKRGSKRNIVKSTIGGLVVDRLANGLRGRR